MKYTHLNAMFWEKNPLNCASPGRSITGPEAVAEVAAMIEAGQVAPPAPVTPEVKAKGGVKAKAVAPPKATPKVPSKAAGVSAPVYEARFVRGQWFLCQINPNTGVESLQPLDPSDYFPEPSGHAEEVPGPDSIVLYDETRANLFTPGTKHDNRYSDGAMVPVASGVPAIFPRPGLDDAEDESEYESAGEVADPVQVWDVVKVHDPKKGIKGKDYTCHSFHLQYLNTLF